MDTQRVEMDTKAFVEPTTRKRDLRKERDGVHLFPWGHRPGFVQLSLNPLCQVVSGLDSLHPEACEISSVSYGLRDNGEK